MSRVRVELAGQGVLEGQTVTTKSGFRYKSFSGVPYAKPPVGDLRFKDPIPNEQWKGVLDATKPSKICAQFDQVWLNKNTFVGEEDCLYLNVYVPDSAKKGDKLPVMFWVHGGGYTSGSGSPDIYGPDYLIQHDVILVTINYRLGVLGFLCLDMEEAAGNMGMKDQALALRWVNKHIATFGGDPDNVTLFGESAGADAVHCLMLSQSTQGMFSRAILQSGTACCEWTTPLDSLRTAFNIGEALGLKTPNKKELVEFLKQIPVDKLIMASICPTLVDGTTLRYGTAVEKHIPNISPFLTESRLSKMEKEDFPKIPIMAGCMSNEGLLILLLHYEKFDLDKNDTVDLATMIPDFKMFIPRHLQQKFDDKKKDIAAQKIKEFYFPDGCDVLKSYQLFQSDFSFIKDIDFTIRKFSKHSPTFFYNFGFKGSLNFMNLLVPFPYEGACHVDDLGYLFSINLDLLKNVKVDVTEREILTIKRMTEMWTNFAKYGDPTPEVTDVLTTKWKPVSGEEINCLDIGDTLTLVNNPYKERVQFWKTLEDL